MFIFNNKNIASPLDGKCIPLSDVKDEVFANEMMGPGYAIIPTCEEVVSPVNGKVSVIASTKHCIVIVGDDGIEVMIHFGLDSFKTEGKGFAYCVEVNDTVKKNQPICKLDLSYFNEENIDMTSPIIILNHDKFKLEDSSFVNCDIKKGDILFKYK